MTSCSRAVDGVNRMHHTVSSACLTTRDSIYVTCGTQLICTAVKLLFVAEMMSKYCRALLVDGNCNSYCSEQG